MVCRTFVHPRSGLRLRCTPTSTEGSGDWGDWREWGLGGGWVLAQPPRDLKTTRRNPAYGPEGPRGRFSTRGTSSPHGCGNPTTASWSSPTAEARVPSPACPLAIYAFYGHFFSLIVGHVFVTHKVGKMWVFSKSARTLFLCLGDSMIIPPMANFLALIPVLPLTVDSCGLFADAIFISETVFFFQYFFLPSSLKRMAWHSYHKSLLKFFLDKFKDAVSHFF